MSKYIFPAIFTLDTNDQVYPNGVYLVDFPDLEGSYTFDGTLAEAYDMAEDVLATTLLYMKEQNKDIPPMSNPKDIKCDSNSFIGLVKIDLDNYN